MDFTLTLVDFLFKSSYNLCSFSLRILNIDNGNLSNVEQPMRLLCADSENKTIFVEAFGHDVSNDLKQLRVNDIVCFENVSISTPDADKNAGSTSKTVLTYHCQSTMTRCAQATALNGRDQDFGVTRFNARLMEIHLEDGGDFVSMHLVGAKGVEFDVLTEGATTTNFFYQKFLEGHLKTGSVVQLSGLTLEPWDNGVMAILRGERATITVPNAEGRVQRFSPSLRII
ncbi:hypothetical protein QR680_000702 [Steinernema hermaphroditum]|uniref:Uncharacterized protein n=1 Tax=Steinernema hermaphroditum TaxID=289476 RepID=A0AA39LER9_9BILA|nr:hypothetical protein QR680_000702 [Steinernema hermaphroditum]